MLAWPLRRLALIVAVVGFAVVASPRISPAVHGAPDARSEIERSDAFWSDLAAPGLYSQNYSSVAAMTKAVHAVVLGRIVDIHAGTFMTFGEVPDGPEYAFLAEPFPILIATVEIESVLKGELNARSAGRLEVALEMPWPGWEQTLLGVIPQGRHMFFLMNDERQRAELGFPAKDADNSRYIYWRPNGDQAVLREIDGHVSVIEPVDGRFPSELDGLEFAALILQVTAASIEPM